MKCIIIAGMPASGKTTFAHRAKEHFHLPIIEKDELKEVLFDTLGFSCYSEKRRLDIAANALLFTVIQKMTETKKPFIVVNNFSENGSATLDKLLCESSYEAITVFFGGDADVFYKRYVLRDNAHARHLGHIVQDHYPLSEGDCRDYEMTREEFAEKFEKRGMADFRISGKRIEVDASDFQGINFEKLLEEIGEYLI